MFSNRIDSAVFFGLVLLSSTLVGTNAEETENGIYNSTNDYSTPLSFAQWCGSAGGQNFCNLRLFMLVGGELMMVDSGSSTLAFCDTPNPDYVRDIQRVQVFDEFNEPRNLSQCTKYGAGTHGWYGETYTGTIESNGVVSTGGTFAIMNKSVGLVGNQCGPILEGSVGIENSTDAVRGIMGIGRNDKFMFSDQIIGESWTDGAIESGRCLRYECECPRPVAKGFYSSFMLSLYYNDIYQFAITWDGSIGKDSGKLLWNEEAESAIPDYYPKIPIVMERKLSNGLFSSNVSAIFVNGVNMNVSTLQYYFDTGSGYISLPSKVYDFVNESDEPSVIDFYYYTLEDWQFGNETFNTTFFNVTVTRELLDARVFRKSYAGLPKFFGLNVFRYIDNILINFNGTEAYFQSTIREHILDLPEDLPLGELIGSASNETQELNITNATTGEIETNTTTFISEVITNITQFSAAPNHWNTRSMVTTTVLFVSTVATCWL
jgi:hypothetical protein